MPFIVLAASLACCASLEKRVNLTYRTAVYGLTGSGEVYLAWPILEEKLQRLPGGRVVLGSVEGAGTQIVTENDVSRWVADALAGELQSARFGVKSAAVLPAGVSKGVLVRVLELSAGQTTDRLVLTTSTNIRLAADVWKDGRLAKTLTAAASSQDQGLDRSGDFVGASLGKTLQLVMEELVPGIVSTLR